MEALGGMLGGGGAGGSALATGGTAGGAAGSTIMGGGALGTQGAAMTTGTGGFAGTGATTGGSTLGSTVSSAMPYVQGAQQVMNLVGPQGSLVKGNPQAIFNDVNGLSQSYDKTFGASPLSQSGVQGSAEVLGRGTTDSFKDLTPDIQKEVLKILMKGK